MPLPHRVRARIAPPDHPDQLRFDFGDPGPEGGPAAGSFAGDAAEPRLRIAVPRSAACRARTSDAADDDQLTLF
jgi:hypothetical protein